MKFYYDMVESKAVFVEGFQVLVGYKEMVAVVKIKNVPLTEELWLRKKCSSLPKRDQGNLIKGCFALCFDT